jgi:MFS family permease
LAIDIFISFISTLGMTIAGVVCLGVSVAFIFVPLLSEIIAAVQEKENMGENHVLNDKASGIFNTSYATGCIVAPILGGALDD